LYRLSAFVSSSINSPASKPKTQLTSPRFHWLGAFICMISHHNSLEKRLPRLSSKRFTFVIAFSYLAICWHSTALGLVAQPAQPSQSPQPVYRQPVLEQLPEPGRPFEHRVPPPLNPSVTVSRSQPVSIQRANSSSPRSSTSLGNDTPLGSDTPIGSDLSLGKGRSLGNLPSMGSSIGAAPSHSPSHFPAPAIQPSVAANFPSNPSLKDSWRNGPDLHQAQSLAMMNQSHQRQFDRQEAYPTQHFGDLLAQQQQVQQNQQQFSTAFEQAPVDIPSYASGVADCASCEPNFYLSLFGGNVDPHRQTSSDSQIWGDNGPGFGLAIGQRHGRNLRMDIEYTYRNHDIDGIATGGISRGVSGDMTAHSGMANLYWEFVRFPTQRFKPYLGAGLGFASFETDLSDGAGSTVLSNPEENDSSMAYQFMAGVNYQTNRNFDLFLEYRLFGADSFRIDTIPGAGGGNYNYEADNLFGGLRWNF
jgi:opacity protein-like surface antigen